MSQAAPDRSIREWRNAGAFAALTRKGDIRAWGSPAHGGMLSPEAAAIKDVRQIYSTVSAFAALNEKGEVVAWGSNGGDASAVADQLKGGIRSIASTTEAFAALNVDGGVVTWGTPRFGGDTRDLSEVLSSDVVEIFSTDHAFAALKKDGSVVGWGDEFSGGFRGKSGIDVATDVRTIRTTSGAFAALREDNTVQTWGYWNHGGVPEGQVAIALASGQVKEIYSNEFAFAALLKDRTVVSWGSESSGGDSSGIQDRLLDVDRIVGNRNAFAAITRQGGVIGWGISGENYVDVADELQFNVVDVVASDQAFAARTREGSVVTWGSDYYGADRSNVSGELSGGVVDIVASKSAFAALKRDGSVVVWGDPEAGGDASSVQQDLRGGVEKLYANDSAFVALKSDGRVVAWGDDQAGGSTRFASGGALKGIVNLADVFTDEFIGNEFQDPVDLGAQPIQRVEINPINPITSVRKRSDLLTGTSEQDLFINGIGRDRVRSQEGADVLWFDRPEKFGKKHAEKILDYQSSEDVIVLGGNRFAGMSDQPEFLSVRRKSDLKGALRTEVEFIYRADKGQLFFNANGADKGYGDGGLFALLRGKPEINVLSFGFTD